MESGIVCDQEASILEDSGLRSIGSYTYAGSAVSRAVLGFLLHLDSPSQLYCVGELGDFSSSPHHLNTPTGTHSVKVSG
eukprot:COSAG02_NODE_1864_length_10606_cov_17.350148_9_plen_79_part_00